jgi:hypothetical protein
VGVEDGEYVIKGLKRRAVAGMVRSRKNTLIRPRSEAEGKESEKRRRKGARSEMAWRVGLRGVGKAD